MSLLTYYVNVWIAAVRRVDCGIERSLTDEDMAEVRRYFKGPAGKKLQAA